MKEKLKEHILPVFFGLSACSWMPHWACHYYRLETGTSFVVGRWSFSSFDSSVSLIIYGFLIMINLIAISPGNLRMTASSITGICHILIGSIHVYRLWNPFPFEVFGYTWSLGASLREAVIVIPFGILCLIVTSKLFFKKFDMHQERQ